MDDIKTPELRLEAIRLNLSQYRKQPNKENHDELVWHILALLNQIKRGE